MAGEKILLVDDDPTILSTLTRFLTGQGYTVAAAANGQEALAALQAEDIPLAILDLMLPDISGLELLAHVREHFPDTEVILFTGLGGLDSAIQALRLGAYDYLVKATLRLPELQSVVDRALERRRLALANRTLLRGPPAGPGGVGPHPGPGADPDPPHRRNPVRAPDHPGAGERPVGPDLGKSSPEPVGHQA
jgi:DNA-binding NtrC family response regulator